MPLQQLRQVFHYQPLKQLSGQVKLPLPALAYQYTRFVAFSQNYNIAIDLIISDLLKQKEPINRIFVYTIVLIIRHIY